MNNEHVLDAKGISFRDKATYELVLEFVCGEDNTNDLYPSETDFVKNCLKEFFRGNTDNDWVRLTFEVKKKREEFTYVRNMTK